MAEVDNHPRTALFRGPLIIRLIEMVVQLFEVVLGSHGVGEEVITKVEDDGRISQSMKEKIFVRDLAHRGMTGGRGNRQEKIGTLKGFVMIGDHSGERTTDSWIAWIGIEMSTRLGESNTRRITTPDEPVRRPLDLRPLTIRLLLNRTDPVPGVRHYRSLIEKRVTCAECQASITHLGTFVLKA